MAHDPRSEVNARMPAIPPLRLELHCPTCRTLALQPRGCRAPLPPLWSTQPHGLPPHALGHDHDLLTSPELARRRASLFEALHHLFGGRYALEHSTVAHKTCAEP